MIGIPTIADGTKYFRDMIAHDFNGVIETSFNQAIDPIAKGHLLILVLTQMIR